MLSWLRVCSNILIVTYRTTVETLTLFGDCPEGIPKGCDHLNSLDSFTVLTFKAHNTMCCGQVQFQFDGVDACSSRDVHAQIGDLTSGCGCGPIGHNPHNHLFS